MLDDGSAADILYLNAYERMDLTKDDLDPNSSPFYGFTRDHVVPKGVVKLTIIMGNILEPLPFSVISLWLLPHKL